MVISRTFPCGYTAVEANRFTNVVNVFNFNNTGTRIHPSTRFSDLFHSYTRRLCRQCGRQQRCTENIKIEALPDHRYLILAVNNITLATNRFRQK